MRSPVYKLLVFALLFIAGTLLAGVMLVIVAMLKGYGASEMFNLMSEGAAEIPSDILGASLWIQTVATFIIPSLLFGLIYYKNDLLGYFQLKSWPSVRVLGLAMIILISGYPIVQLSYEINQLLPVSDWMVEMEQNAAEMLGEILNMDSFGAFIMTLIAVAVLPAIGEELVFRGIIQKQLSEWTKNPVLGIWLAAFVFSAIHMQFEGFLPRMVLGAILGYLYYWTKSLWVPMFIHFLNNGVQVAVLYASGMDLSQIDDSSTEKLSWWVIVIAAIILAGASHLLIKSVKTVNTSE